jgi:L-galactose dehydrogenase/L-glyceraldehyde 3-phosphate reductase
MERRPLGRTGLTVSALGFGCGAVGGLMVRGEPAAQTWAVARALEAGIRYFDTAPSYGDGRSEESLGRVLGELRPRDVVVGTKFRLDAGDEADAGGAVRRSLEASLRRLRLERVDLLQLHNRIGRPDGLSPDLVLGPAVEALGRLREDGLIGHFGVTATGETAALHRVVSSGRIATAQCYFNALNPSAGWAGRARRGGQDFDGLIDRAADAGVGVIVIRPLAAGAVADGGPRHPNAGGAGGAIAGTTFEQDAADATALADLAGTLGLEGPVELALRLALAKPGVSTVIVGYSDQAQLEEAIRYAERGALPDDAVARVLDRAAGAG